MAVYPDAIILKESTDSDASIKAAVGSGGASAISAGEVVVGRGNGTIALYALDANGAVQSIGTGSPGGGAGNAAKRVDETKITAGLANGAYEDVSFTGLGQSGDFVHLVFSHAAKIEFFPTAADRTAGTNVLLSRTATGAGTVVITEAAGNCYYNNDTTAAQVIYARITNQSGGTTPITITARAYANSAGDVFANNGASVTTASLANGASANVTLPGTGKYGEFLQITTNVAAWVTVYCSTAARTADASRTSTTDPTPASGVLLEAITTAGKLTLPITPSAAYFNLETPRAGELYLKVENRAGTTSTVTVTFDVMVIQA